MNSSSTEGRPSAPLNVTATSFGGCATIRWQRPHYLPAPAFKYLVYSDDLQHSANSTTQFAVICGLAANQTLAFRVQAFNYHGRSPWSADSNTLTIQRERNCSVVVSDWLLGLQRQFHRSRWEFSRRMSCRTIPTALRSASIRRPTLARCRSCTICSCRRRLTTRPHVTRRPASSADSFLVRSVVLVVTAF